MSNGSMKMAIDELLRLPAEGLKDKFPRVLEEIQKYGIGRLLSEYPGFLARLLGRLKQVNASRLFNEVPGSADQLTSTARRSTG